MNNPLDDFLDQVENLEPGLFRILKGEEARKYLDSLRRGMDMMKRQAKNPSAAAKQLRAIPSEKRAQASRENGKKGGLPKNRTCPICGKSVSVYRFADKWRFNQHYTDEKREDSVYPFYECVNSYAVAE